MKSKIIFVALLSFISLKSFSQTKNAINFQYGLSATKVMPAGTMMGGANYSDRNGKTFGLIYTHSLNSPWSLSTGLTYSTDYYHFNPEPGFGSQPNPNDSKINLISVPVIANLTFLKYLFINGGVTIDIQTSKKQELQSQSGVGLELGAGGKYKFGSVELFVNPYLQRHNVTGGMNLYNAGAKFGVGYCF